MKLFQVLARVFGSSAPARPREPVASRPAAPAQPVRADAHLQDVFEPAPGREVVAPAQGAQRPTWAQSQRDGFDGVRRPLIDLSGGVKVPTLALEPLDPQPVEPSNGFLASLDDLPVDAPLPMNLDEAAAAA